MSNESVMKGNDDHDSRPLIFWNGPVFGQPVGTAVLSSSGLLAVGNQQDLLTLVPTEAERIDLDGRMLVPGFQDAHIHPAMGGMMRLRCNLEPAQRPEDAIRIIENYVSDHPEAPWILGGGWRYRWYPGGNPGASLLDTITDVPVYLEVADGHSGWANTSALRAAGIDESTFDPPDGIIVRDETGRPSGTLHEGAMRLIERILPPDSENDIDAALTESQAYLFSLGITAWQDAWVTQAFHRAYRRLDHSGALTARVRGALWWDRERGIEQLDEIRSLSTESTERYNPGTVKLMLDGVCENFTASMIEPYRTIDGAVTDNHGIDFIDTSQLREIVTAIDAAGLQCHFHALGDRAVRSALDAIEHARERNGARDARPHLAHLQMIDPIDIPRFAALGATANIQPLWACEEQAMRELTIPFLPPDRVGLQYPFGSIERSGARLAMGSDWSVSTPDVLDQISVAVTRTRPERDATEPFLPAERISVQSALTAVTAGSAYVNFFDSDSGSISSGMRSDVAVLSDDPTMVDTISDVTVDLTVVGGRVVYRA